MLNRLMAGGQHRAALLRPVTEVMRGRGAGPLRVVDVGCGLGFVVRAMAASPALGPDVELAGVDLNPVLVAEARRLAGLEGLACSFTQGDAFRPGPAVKDGARCVVISSGLMHHLPGSGLADFPAAQSRLGAAGFAHWDIAPCLWSTLGAWVFHHARMREPVSRHDGVLSARRACTAAVLQAAARTGAPGYDVQVHEGSRWHPGALDGAFAGFRSPAGRTGLTGHRQSGHQAARRGAVLALVLLAPVIAATSAGILIHPVHRGDCTRAGTAMLAVYGPYALLVLIALACYAMPGWRLKYLAATLIPGPFTLLRPGIAILGAALAMTPGNDLAAAIMAGLSAAAVLAVQPLAGRLRYARNPPGPAS